MIKLGKKGEDKITGFKGIVTARHTYITGCDQYTLSGKMNKDGTMGDNYSFDEGRIKVTGDGVSIAEVQTKVLGGPQHPAKSAK